MYRNDKTRKALRALVNILAALPVWGGLALGILASCSEKDDSYDPYHDWGRRNTEWFEQIADSARTAILQAQAQDPKHWEDNCPWRMYQSTALKADQQGPVTDSICMRYIRRGTATDSPAWNDSVRVNYRGTLMPTINRIGQHDTLIAKVFDQSFYGPYNPATAYPQQFLLSSTVTGFATALQHMHPGDEVILYIPYQLAYGSAKQNNVPAYSTLCFHLHLIEFFRPGETIPEWK